MMQIGIVGMGRNGYMNQIMQSQEDADKIISECETLINNGVTFSSVIECACQKQNIVFNNLALTDKKRIERKVEEIDQSHQSRRR